MTSALQGVSKAFTEALPQSAATREQPTRERPAGSDAVKEAEAAAAQAKAEAEADSCPARSRRARRSRTRSTTSNGHGRIGRSRRSPRDLGKEAGRELLLCSDQQPIS